ncbi:MAG: zf-HC2 domain-containing protein [Candidatus Dormibacteraeota bacterium]|nr:zf-HC2 domain-containing protein [Candidatus Dormibacteraeota bacterium]MBV9525580.1 zf-HC2 domain-containing protein [Candidatus Dormibacteraeota bacterium]
MATEHVADLFSAAIDRELSAEQARRFRNHLDACDTCRRDYGVYRQSVEAVRALPHARMPIPVHVPAGEPARARMGLAGLFARLPRPRLIPGGATALAAVAAAVILVLVTHGAPAGRTLSSGANAPAAGGNAGPQSAVTVPGACTPATSSLTASSPPPGFQQVRASTAGARPGQRLVLATASATAAPGSSVVVFAQLALPRAGAAPPGGGAPSPLTLAVNPCLTVSDAARALAVAPLGPVAEGNPAATDSSKGSAAPGLQTVTIPAGTPAGTVVHIVATIPAGFPTPGEPALTAELTVTVQ